MKYLQELRDYEICDCLKEFNKDIDIFDREASYHFCYNYFRNFYEDDNVKEISSSNNIEVSCLQLGFYLASWGMYRGSGKIYYKSNKVYEGIIKKIPEGKSLWEIDVDNYNENNINKILKFKNELQKSLHEHKITATDTLTTKIMMGVFGCVPAFDINFTTAIKESELRERSLIKVKEFYDRNRKTIDNYIGTDKFKTFDRATGGKVFNYKKAKIIDMIGVTLGEHIIKETKQQKMKKESSTS